MKTKIKNVKNLAKYTWIISILWLVIILTSFFWNVFTSNNHSVELAKIEARANFNKDFAIRLWATKHGGVYVPKNERTPSNPSLSHIPDREITKPNGDTLTLMNPAYMIRQMFDEFPKEYGVVGRIVSLKPLNPNNAPDDWEREALLSFESGKKEVFEVANINGPQYLRLMQPMVTTEGCLKCHAFQGYKVGDIRGGVGVSVPMSTYIEYADSETLQLGFGYSLILLFGFVGIGFGFRLLGKKIIEQERAELVIKESEIKFRTVADYTYDWEYWQNPDKSFEYISPACERITGYSVDEFITNPKLLENLIFDEDKDIWNTHLHEHEKQALREIQVRIKRKDGEIVWIEHSCRPVTNDEGDFLGYRASNRDVTERKQMEENLARAEEYYRGLTEVSPAGIWVTDAEGNNTYVSPRWTEITGINSEDAKGPGWSKGIHPEDKATVFEEWLEAASNDMNYKSEFRFMRPGNEIKWVLCIATPQKEDGKLTRWIGTITDITERKQAEEESKEKDERIKLALEGTSAGIWDWNIQTGETVFNERWAEIIGYSLEEISPVSIETWMKYAHPDDSKKSEELLEKHFKGETDYYEFESRMKHKNSKWIWVIDRGKVVEWDKDGKPLRMTGTHADISERKQAEQTLKESEQKLREINAEKDKFFSIIAHDLKSPFNGIMGFSQLLIEQVQKEDYDGIEKYAGIILDSSQRAVDLLMNLMEWARSQTGRMEFTPEYLKIADLCNETVDLLRPIAGQKYITIKKEIPNKAIAFADKAMISTVIRNLVSNAIKFTQSGGEIVVSAHEKSGELIISVSDTGVGIPKDRLEKLFILSESYSTSGTNNEKGTGLGLILCKEFIEKNGGRIWVESDPDRKSGAGGSIFYFTIPTKPL
ncbi:PAS domain-containing protein [Lentimicrobium sp. S6]|uniref:PAS domain-containing protein n=1 Tax=Lentimicrobium sp. S6 TaxID=2735872 RepID=UPI001556524F|nr:PAS domain-containing protein [Lentimicrobium sp. S6]NPD48258.1 PAS domain-containing protein [Lentimicrobium sp. S6]